MTVHAQQRQVPASPAPLDPTGRLATTSSYSALARAVRESGLLRRRYAYYWSRITLAVLAFAGVIAGVVWLGNSWWQLVLAALLGLVVTQFGFLGHDAAHRQIFLKASWNDWTSRILSGVFAGLSYGWWRGKHARHHATPNQEGRDPDVAPGTFAFTGGIAAERTEGLPAWFVQRQGWLFFPLLMFEGLNLHWSGIRFLSGRGPVPHRATEAVMVTVRLTTYVGGLLVLLPAGKAAAFFAVQMAVFGVCLGGSFAPNHKGMPIVPRTMKIDFLRRQVLMSRNVRGGFVVDAAMGGLNYQIEHHLFPSMPRPNLKLAQPLVRAYCADHDVLYTEGGLFESYGIVIDYLNHVGLRSRGPFDCPLASQLGR
jgi:fatty acid desaturase